MEVDWTMLANYAEDNGGLLYIQGGTWDTITVGSPLEGGPPNAFTLIRGYYIARLAFHPTETNREHGFEVIILGEDGAEIAKVGGDIQVPRMPGLPATWMQHFNLVLPLTGVMLPQPGLYRIDLLVNGSHEHELQFRVIKGF